MKISDGISVEELTRAAKIAARVVVLYGETYLPIFNRLHKELERAKEKEQTKDAAIQLAKIFAKQNDCH